MSIATADLVGAAEARGEYTVMLELLSAAGLLATLRGEGPFTLFAPNDTAFESFPAATLEKLKRNESRGLLTSVLSYHFAIGQVSARQFAGKRIRATTYAGRHLRIDGSDGLRVAGALVVDPDVSASNGVLHGIDRVLWPTFRDRSAPAALST